MVAPIASVADAYLKLNSLSLVILQRPKLALATESSKIDLHVGECFAMLSIVNTWSTFRRLSFSP